MNNQQDNWRVVCVAPPSGGVCGGSQEVEIDLLALWNVVWRRKFFLIGVTAVAALAAVYVTLFRLPVTYQSQAVLLPTGVDSGAKGALSGLASSLPIPTSLLGTGGSGSQLIMVFLGSRNFKMKLIDKYDLLPRFYKQQWDSEQKKWLVDDPKAKPSLTRAIQGNVLDGILTVSQDKKTELITLAWVDEDPEFAAQMLQRVIVELNYFLVNDYESDAKRERKFVENQLAAAVGELEEWEQRVPSDDLSLAKIKREVLAATTVYGELRKQLELAKLTEEKEVVNFKVLDPPFVPEIKFKPKRAVICLLTMATAAVMALLVVFAQEGVAAFRANKKAVVQEAK